jgi:hypothetical protein
VRILVSSYRNPIYDELLNHGWKIKEVKRKTTVSLKRSERVEALYYNYELPTKKEGKLI